MPSSYILRNLTPEQSSAFNRALDRAKADGRSFKWVVVRLVELYAKVGLEKLEGAVNDV